MPDAPSPPQLTAATAATSLTSLLDLTPDDEWPFLLPVHPDLDNRAPMAYAELRRLARSLRPALSPYVGLRVAASLPNGPELAALTLALTGLGVGFGPLNPELKPAEVLFELQDLPAAAVVV